MKKNIVISLTGFQRTLLLVLLAFATASVAFLSPLTRAQEAQKLSAPSAPSSQWGSGSGAAPRSKARRGS